MLDHRDPAERVWSKQAQELLALARAQFEGFTAAESETVRVAASPDRYAFCGQTRSDDDRIRPGHESTMNTASERTLSAGLLWTRTPSSLLIPKEFEFGEPS